MVSSLAFLQVRYIYILTVSLSFFSLSYEMILAKKMAFFLQNEVVGQSLGIGLFLLGLGLGTALSTKIRRNQESSLLRVEGILIVLIVLMPLAFALLKASEILIHTTAVYEFSVLTSKTFFALLGLLLLVGFLSGFELPLLLNMASRRNIRIELSLFLNYLGAFFAGLLIPLVFIPNLGANQSLYLIVALNLLFALGIWIIFHGQMNTAKLISLFFSATLFLFSFFSYHKFEQFSLKVQYLDLRMGEFSFKGFINVFRQSQKIPDIQRFETRIQTADFIWPETFRKLGRESDIEMYLDMAPQFSASNQTIYHESMVGAAFALSSSPIEEAIIFGGGDGLLATQLLRFGVEKVRKIEIDEKLVNLFKSHFLLRNLNRGSLDKIEVIYGDAFHYIFQPGECFPAIFIDFPFPNNYELARLYSVEFYKQLYDRVCEDGFVILDAPIWLQLGSESEVKNERILTQYATLRAAGWHNYFTFGTNAAFIYLSKSQRKLEYKMSSFISEKLTDASFMNLFELDIMSEIDSLLDNPDYVNTLMRPRSSL